MSVMGSDVSNNLHHEVNTQLDTRVTSLPSSHHTSDSSLISHTSPQTTSQHLFSLDRGRVSTGWEAGLAWLRRDTTDSEKKIKKQKEGRGIFALHRSAADSPQTLCMMRLAEEQKSPEEGECIFNYNILWKMKVPVIFKENDVKNMFCICNIIDHFKLKKKRVVEKCFRLVVTLYKTIIYNII